METKSLNSHFCFADCILEVYNGCVFSDNSSFFYGLLPKGELQWNWVKFNKDTIKWPSLSNHDWQDYIWKFQKGKFVKKNKDVELFMEQFVSDYYDYISVKDDEFEVKNGWVMEWTKFPHNCGNRVKLILTNSL